MSASVHGGWRVFFSFMAAVVLGGALLLGCDPREEIELGIKDGALILPSDQAWTFGDSGLIFTPDGRIFAITYVNTDDTLKPNWKISKEGVYTILGDTVTQNYSPRDSTMRVIYTVRISSDGRKLTRKTSGRERVFTRTTVGRVALPPVNPGLGGELVLDSGQAWINDEDDSWGISYRNDSTMAVIRERSGGGWEVYAYGIYLVADGQITMVLMTANGQKMTGTYTVSGDNLVMTIVGEDGTKSFTKRSGIYLTTPPPPSDSTGNSGSIAGDWTLYSYSRDGKPYYYNDNSDGKRIISFKTSTEGSAWMFKKIGAKWVEFPFTKDGETKLLVEGQTIHIVRDSVDEKWGTYTVSENKLIVLGQGFENRCDVLGCATDTLIRVKASDIRDSLATVKYNPSLIGKWVLLGGSPENDYISFGSYSFEGPGFSHYNTMGIDYDYYKDAEYYTTGDSLYMGAKTYFSDHDYWFDLNIYVPCKVSASGDSLTIRNDIWILVAPAGGGGSVTPAAAKSRQSERTGGPSATNSKGRLQ
jgi:hypothetical protein